MMHTPAKITVFADKRTKPLGDLFGLFFEDLNHAADGGLYGELIQNRSFEFNFQDNRNYNPLTAWELVERGTSKARIHVENSRPISENNQNYLVLESTVAGEGAGFRNVGYNTGIPLNEGEIYHFSCFYRRESSASAEIFVLLESVDGRCLGQASFTADSMEWTKIGFDIKSSAADNSARLTVIAMEKVTVAFDMVSLFPKKTFLGRENGMREDIALLLADMKPKFMRFPGGCLVHDGSLDRFSRVSQYRWKNTVGKLEERRTCRNNWGYNQSYGLGFFELFQFCEDIGAKPLPVISAGYDPHSHRGTPLDEMQEWIDDALDLIEFANGSVDSEWGGLRAEMGHPEPFNMEYLGIGNEEVGEEFFIRYAIVHRAVREKYPEIKLINTSGPFCSGGEYERGWKSARDNGSDFVDEHYYQSALWYEANMHRYDNFDPDEPKVFLGEYASWSNEYRNAIVEAAYMTGLEKAPAVGLACYAPMLANTDYTNWRPDMVYYNNHKSFGSANYHVQKLFMQHQGDYLLHVKQENFDEPLKFTEDVTSGYISFSTGSASVSFYDIKVTDLTTGAVTECADTQISKDNKKAVVCENQELTHHSISFKAKKKREHENMSVWGGTGFELNFSERDKKNFMSWTVGGWQNQDSMFNKTINGSGFGFAQSLFTFGFDKEYSFRVEITGRRICGYIDDECVADEEYRLPETEMLYVTSSVEESSGDVIIKAVNLRDAEVESKIEVNGISGDRRTVKIYSMSGNDAHDVNSFDEPDKVCTSNSEMQVSGNSFIYKFPPLSLTVFRI